MMILPTARVRELTDEHPELAWAFLNEFANKIVRLERRVEGLSLLSVDQRLARYLLDHVGPENRVELSMKSEELASYLGTARESLSRAFVRLEREELVKRDGKFVFLLDKRRLVVL